MVNGVQNIAHKSKQVIHNLISELHYCIKRGIYMKTNFVNILCLLIMLLAISGCSYESDDLVNSPVEKIIETQTIEHELSHESNDSDHFHVEKNTEDQATEHELSYQSGYRFGIANPKDNADIKSELIDYITEFNTLTPSSIEATAANIQDYNFEEFYEQAYIDNNISEIESFYFPTVSIEGYKLYRAIIDEWSFMYYYAPIEKLESNDEYIFEFNDGILLGFDRPHWIDSENPLGSEINKMNVQNRSYELRNDLLYKPDANSVLGAIGGTRFTLNVPDTLNNAEYLFSIGEAIIQTSELIAVN